MQTEIAIRNLSGRQLDLAPLCSTARKALELEAALLEGLSLALVDDERIAGLNQRLLGREGTTDVIAFEAEDGEGEIIISVDTAQRQAAEQGHGLTAELQFLVAHGVLHVLGWDDTAPEDRERMLKRQDEIVQAT